MSTATRCWSSTWFSEQRSPWHIFSPQQLAPTPSIPWLVADISMGQGPFPVSSLDWATLFQRLRQNHDLDVAVNRTRLRSVTDLQAQSPRFEICASKRDSWIYIWKWTEAFLHRADVLPCFSDYSSPTCKISVSFQFLPGRFKFFSMTVLLIQIKKEYQEKNAVVNTKCTVLKS